jgi:8-oxo-dGTP diphosphatase
MQQPYPSHLLPPTFLTADLVIRSGDEVLLIKRGHAPYEGCWALPGGFMDPQDHDIRATAVRELIEETQIAFEPSQLTMIGVFSRKGRDPRETHATKPCRIASVAYLCDIASKHSVSPKAADDAAEVGWFSLDSLPDFAFDHEEILEAASLYDEEKFDEF